MQWYDEKEVPCVFAGKTYENNDMFFSDKYIGVDEYGYSQSVIKVEFLDEIGKWSCWVWADSLEDGKLIESYDIFHPKLVITFPDLGDENG